MNLVERFKEEIRSKHLFSVKDKLILAVSGGVDSVVLCELCKQAGYDFSILHCNFQLRGKESLRDEAFVKKLGKIYKTDVKVKSFETDKYADDKKLSIQEAARELRYKWFDEMVGREREVTGRGEENLPAPHSPPGIYLLTAHHADDNIETVLMNFFRGTGLHGLTGIPVKNDYIRRPLLSFFKEELVTFAKENKLEWVEDSSNISSDYTRNYFRNEVISLVQKRFSQVKENLAGNILRFTDIEDLYKVSTAALAGKLLKKRGNELHIPVKQLIEYNSKSLIYEIISKFGFTEKQVDEVIKLTKAESGKYIQASNNTYRIIRYRHWLIITLASNPETETVLIHENEQEIEYSAGKLEFEECIEKNIPVSQNMAALDKKEIVYPLLLRKWKRGDYFYPLGMRKKKKLSRFFIDEKFSKTQKEKAWVLETAGRIIWLVGHRIDDRFKLEEKTKEVLRIKLVPKLD